MPKSIFVDTRRAGQLLVVGFAALLSACTTATNAPPLSSAPASAQGEYRLTAGDKLRIVVYGERDLSGDFVVGSDGAINMPLIGAVPAKGLTPGQLRDALAAGFGKGYLREPQIVVDVTSIRPYYMTGEINRPGEYPTTQGLTIAGAIAKAQGFSYRADRKKVYIRRNGEEQEYVADPNKAEPVLPGDIIRVGERFF